MMTTFLQDENSEKKVIPIIPLPEVLGIKSTITITDIF